MRKVKIKTPIIEFIITVFLGSTVILLMSPGILLLVLRDKVRYG